LKLTRAHLKGLSLAAIIAGALVLGARHRKDDPSGVEVAAERALAQLDKRTSREALTARCQAHTPARANATGILDRACAALHELGTFSNEPLAAASRLSELTHARASSRTQRDVLAEVQSLRVELLMTAGHSREAAREGQAWADGRRKEASVGAVRLWVAASRANQAIGEDDLAHDDAKRAVWLAARVK